MSSRRERPEMLLNIFMMFRTVPTIELSSHLVLRPTALTSLGSLLEIDSYTYPRATTIGI